MGSNEQPFDHLRLPELDFGWSTLHVILDPTASAVEVAEAVVLASPSEIAEAERRLRLAIGTLAVKIRALEESLGQLVNDFPALKSVRPPQG